MKINLNFYFYTSLWCLKEVWKSKFKLIFSYRSGSRWEGLKVSILPGLWNFVASPLKYIVLGLIISTKEKKIPLWKSTFSLFAVANNYSFNLLSFLIHFSHVPFYTSWKRWKHQKTRGFLRYNGFILIHWDIMDLSISYHWSISIPLENIKNREKNRGFLTLSGDTEKRPVVLNGLIH